MNLGHQAVTTNIEEWLGELSQCYREGFCLNTFVKVPGRKTTIEVANWSDQQPFQTILSKPDRL